MQYREKFIVGNILSISFLVVINCFFHDTIWLWIILLPLILLGLNDYFQKSHAIRRNFPLIGRLRYLFESIRPELQQYFVESDIDGRPINRVDRNVIYQRAKGDVSRRI